MELTCPKCHGAMRNYERSGIQIDQCTECRGVFLDRGELDKIIDAEAAYQAAPQAAAPQAAAPSPGPQAPPWGSRPGGDGYREEYRGDDRDRYRGDDRDRYRDDRYRAEGYRDDRYRGGDHHYGKKRKKSFLDELFD
jgi:hypothetical protein